MLTPTCLDCQAPLTAGVLVCPACGRTARAPRVGEVLEGKYLLEANLTQGGMGAVFVARDLALGRTVAVKSILPQHVGDARMVERLRVEATALARLRHDNLVQVVTFGFHGAFPYLVMEYVVGTSTDRWVGQAVGQGRQLPVAEVAAVLGQVCLALGEVHRVGMVHRDVKPANILVERSGRAVLVDFGIVKREPAGRLTGTGQTQCTVFYAPPEQLRGEPLDGRADLYALAATAYKLLLGRPVFDGPSVQTVAARHLFEPPPPLSRFRSDLPRRLERLLLASLAKEPDRRPSDAATFRAELDAACGPLRPRVRVVPEGVWATKSEGSGEPEAITGPEGDCGSELDWLPTEPHRPLRAPGTRAWLRWMGLAAGLLGLGLLAGLLLWRGTQPEASSIPTAPQARSEPQAAGHSAQEDQAAPLAPVGTATAPDAGLPPSPGSGPAPAARAVRPLPVSEARPAPSPPVTAGPLPAAPPRSTNRNPTSAPQPASPLAVQPTRPRPAPPPTWVPEEMQ